MNQYLFRNVLWTLENKSELRDVIVRDGQIQTELDSQIQTQTIEANGAQALPGLVELFANFRQPGAEHIYSIETGCQAMTRGGFTQALLSPDLSPAPDETPNLRRLQDLTVHASHRLVLAGALSENHMGKRLPEMGEFFSHGVNLLCNGTRPMPNSGYLRSAMEYAGQWKMRLALLPLEASLMGSAFVHEGPYASLLGMKGIPAAAEHIAVHRAIQLAKLTGCAIHLRQITSTESVSLIRTAKSQGMDVTCDVNMHHLLLTDAALPNLDPNTSMLPPLRSQEDQNSLIEGLRDGVIDAICTAHLPVLPDAKATFFEEADPGAVGLEIAFGMLLKSGLPMDLLIQKLSHFPRQFLNLPSELEFFLWDADRPLKIDASLFAGNVYNSPFLGEMMPGQILGTFVRGEWHTGG